MGNIKNSIPDHIVQKLKNDMVEVDGDATHLFIGKRFKVRDLIEQALNGNLDSFGFVASLYFWGHVLEKNSKIALDILEWIISSNITSRPAFEYAYARYLIQLKDFNSAIVHLETLVGESHGMAMTTLAYLYRDGYGVRKNANLYRKYLKNGARTGDPQSRTALMHFYIRKGGIISILMAVLVFLSNIPAIIKLAFTRKYNGRI